MVLWVERIKNAQSAKRSGTWTVDHSECRDPNVLVEQQGRRGLAWADILSAIRRVGIPAASVQGPKFTLVNYDTTFFTDAPGLSRMLDIVGYRVDVVVTPTSYRWSWGDGSTTTSSTPGRPYPATDVTHTYRLATHTGPGYPTRVDVTYAARYRVDGTAWQQVPDALTVPGTTVMLPVRQASAVLTGP